MASSNRHWPSMFKSKPCNTHQQWQHDINQSLCHRTPYASGCEERSPEPKPRWNPKPEQIRILEAIFNSGMVNPPREEIRKIRSQLQAYGQVGDANVFYWFQNRKSRSKHKLRHQLQSSKSQCQNPNPNHNPNPEPTLTNNAPSSSSSSSEKSSPKAMATSDESGFASIGLAAEGAATDIQHHHFFGEPFFFPLAQYSSPPSTVAGQSYAHHDLMMIPNPDQSDHHHEAPQSLGPCTSLLLSEIMNTHGGSKKDFDDHHHQVEKELHYTPSTAPTATLTSHTSERISPGSTARGGSSNVPGAPIASVINHVQVGEEDAQLAVGPGGRGSAKTTVFINDVAFEVPAGAFNVREAFGEGAVLINSYGQPVLTDEWGLTLHSLHHGAFYYLI